jgi:hypothetical protein
LQSITEFVRKKVTKKMLENDSDTEIAYKIYSLNSIPADTRISSIRRAVSTHRHDLGVGRFLSSEQRQKALEKEAKKLLKKYPDDKDSVIVGKLSLTDAGKAYKINTLRFYLREIINYGKIQN